MASNSWYGNKEIPGIKQALRYLCDTKRKYSLYDASVVFNLLCPNERPISKKAFVSAIPPLEGFTIHNDTVVYRKANGEKIDYKQYIRRVVEDLVQAKEIPKDIFLIKKAYEFITDVIIKAVVTAEGYPVKCIMVYTDEILNALYENLIKTNKPIVVDIETDGLDPHTNNIIGIGVSIDASKGWYIPTRKAEFSFATTFGEAIDTTNSIPSFQNILRFVKEILAKKYIIAHNAKFEYSFFKTNYGIEIKICHDTMIGEYILNCSLKDRFSLGISVAERFPKIKTWKEGEDFFKNIKTFPIAKVGTYCVKDCCHTYLLFLAQSQQLLRDFKYITYNIDFPFIKVVAEAELHGFAIDENYLRELNISLLSQIKDLEDEIKAEIKQELNLDSTPQLRELLFTTLNMIPVKYTEKGEASVDAGSLEKLYKNTENLILKKILDRRTLKKIASTYTLSLIEKRNVVTGHIHPSFKMVNTETGRLACTNPNFQNLPKNASDLIRVAVVAPAGKVLVFADYSGQEVRVLAAASKDENLIRCYNPCFKCQYANDQAKCPKLNKSNIQPDYCKPVDVHSLVASKIYKDIIKDTPIWEIKSKFKKERSISKATTFLLCYGGSAETLSVRTGISIDEAVRIFEEYFKLFPGVKHWIRQQYEFALEHGYSQDLLGRRRYYPILNYDPDPMEANPLSPFKNTPRVTNDLKVIGIKSEGGYWRSVMSAMRQCQNQPIQGTSAEMTKEGALYIRDRFRKFPFPASVIGFVHDEIISVCPRNSEAILMTVDAIRNAMTKDIPLVEKYGFPEALSMEVEISVGDNWGNAMPVEEFLTKLL